MTISKNFQRLISRMEVSGYWFDVWESYKGRPVFRYEGACLPMEFSSQKELREWMREALAC